MRFGVWSLGFEIQFGVLRNHVHNSKPQTVFQTLNPKLQTLFKLEIQS